MNCSELNELADAYNKYGEEYRAMYIEDRRDMIDSVKDALAKKPGKTIQIKGVSVSADDFLGIFMDELEESIRTLEKNDQVFKNMTITTNGCFSLEQKWPILKKFQYINFSLHSLNEAYFSTLIGAGRNASIFLDLITNNIKELRQRMSVRINTVVGADENFQKVEDILDFAAKLNIELKLVPEWSVQVLAINNIMNLLSKKGFFYMKKFICFLVQT